METRFALSLHRLVGLSWSIGQGNGIPLQYCYLENPMDGGAWYANVHQLSHTTSTHMSPCVRFSQIAGKEDI